jgi:hypothetical protein
LPVDAAAFAVFGVQALSAELFGTVLAEGRMSWPWCFSGAQLL